jgi:hypothetical protein
MTIARFDGFAMWAELDPEEQAEIGPAALELVAAWNLQERVYEDAIGAPFAKLGDIADARIAQFLMEYFTAYIGREALEAPDGSPRVPSLLGQVCRDCGCTDDNACEGGCGWAKPDLCTACAMEAVECGGDAPPVLVCRESKSGAAP